MAEPSGADPIRRDPLPPVPTVGRGRRVGSLGWLSAAGFTTVLLVLVGIAAGDVADRFWLVVVVAVAGCVSYLYLVFPGSHFFVLALANALAVYACVFTLFVDAHFRLLPPWEVGVGFALPILAFMAGAGLRRKSVRTLIASQPVLHERHLLSALGWLLPLVAIGVGVMTTREHGPLVLLVAQGLIAAVVLAGSRSIAAMLIATGITFEAFTRRVVGLVLPAFAFLTLYSLLVIVFASAYRLVAMLSDAPPFTINGQPQSPSFGDALYFSMITLASVGYGDIVPTGSVARLLVLIEVVSGVLLLLFGLNEIVSHAREHRERYHRAREERKSRREDGEGDG